MPVFELDTGLAQAATGYHLYQLSMAGIFGDFAWGEGNMFGRIRCIAIFSLDIEVNYDGFQRIYYRR